MTQAEVALLAGVSKGTVSNIEKHGQGTLDSLVRVLQAMRLTKELQSLFLTKPSSIMQLEQAEKASERQRVRKKRAACRPAMSIFAAGASSLLGNVASCGRSIARGSVGKR